MALAAARAFGAGPYGAAAWLPLLTYFVMCGVIAASAVLALADRVAPRWVSAIAAALAGAGGTAAALYGMSTPTTSPLLPALFAPAAGVAFLWLATAQRRERTAAAVLAASTAVLLAGALVLDEGSR